MQLWSVVEIRIIKGTDELLRIEKKCRHRSEHNFPLWGEQGQAVHLPPLNTV